MAGSSMIIFWIHKCFILDEDLCLVDYQPIYSDDVEAPVLSLCIVDPFLDAQLQSINPTFNSSYYKKFLMGDVDDDELLKVDYDRVTWNLTNYIAGYRVNFNNGTTVKYKKSDYNPFQNEVDVTYNGFVLSFKYFIKCFGHSVKRDKLKEITSITTKYKFPSVLKQHFVLMHYPKHFLASVKRMKFFMDPNEFKNHPQRWFNVHEMEVLKRRDKNNHVCSNYKKDHDFEREVLLWYGMEKSRCRVPYLNFNKMAPKCSNKEDMKNSAFVFNEDFEDRFRPCEIMSNFRYELEKFNVYPLQSITLALPKSVRVIQQSKSIDTNSLIGYIGGYVGLLLGKFVIITPLCCV